jgi:hypothetical protein
MITLPIMIAFAMGVLVGMALWHWIEGKLNGTTR